MRYITKHVAYSWNGKAALQNNVVNCSLSHAKSDGAKSTRSSDADKTFEVKVMTSLTEGDSGKATYARLNK